MQPTPDRHAGLECGAGLAASPPVSSNACTPTNRKRAARTVLARRFESMEGDRHERRLAFSPLASLEVVCSHADRYLALSAGVRSRPGPGARPAVDSRKHRQCGVYRTRGGHTAPIPTGGELSGLGLHGL